MNKTIEKEALIPFGNLEIRARQVVEGFITGLHKSPFHGFSVEFAEHRLYNPGESTRHIDWKLYGRSEKLFTKKYEEETNLRCQLVVDTSSSMYYNANNNPSKIEFSMLGAASIIELLKKQRDAVGLSLFNERLDAHIPAKSSGAHHRMLIHEMEKCLHNYEPTTKTKTESIQALHDIAELCHKRSLVIIFTDFLENPEHAASFLQAVQHLRHNKHEVVIFHIIDKKTEVNFEMENRPLNLVDMETGEQMKVQPFEVKKAYTDRIQAYFTELELKCIQYSVDFIPADINEGLTAILTKFLLKRQRMR